MGEEDPEQVVPGVVALEHGELDGAVIDEGLEPPATVAIATQAGAPAAAIVTGR